MLEAVAVQIVRHKQPAWMIKISDGVDADLRL